jgi:hypothetical protein
MGWIDAHSHGLEVLGADTGKGVLIRVKNAAELARAQGAMASLVQQLAPATVEGKVYEKLADELRASFKDRKVDADVQVVNVDAWKMSKDTKVGVGLFVASGIAVAGLFGFLARRRSK